MRASWTDIHGRKIVITHIQEIREIGKDLIDVKNDFNSFPMEVYIDGIMTITGYNFQEFCSCIDTEIVLSADKE